MRTYPIALFAALCQPGAALAADLVFVGNLRFVTAEFLTVRLDDGIVIDAKLPKHGDLTAATITAQYRLADRVQITCKSIQAVHDKVEDRYHFLELQKLLLLRPPSPEEVTKVIASVSWQGGDNLFEALGGRAEAGCKATRRSSRRSGACSHGEFRARR